MENIEIKTSLKALKSALVCAHDNAQATAQRIAAEYIRLNPQDEYSRNRDLAIELLGINNLYCKMLDEIERMSK